MAKYKVPANKILKVLAALEEAIRQTFITEYQYVMNRRVLRLQIEMIIAQLKYFIEVNGVEFAFPVDESNACTVKHVILWAHPFLEEKGFEIDEWLIRYNK